MLDVESTALAKRALGTYFAVVCAVSIASHRAFAGKFARGHRLAGLAHLGVLAARASALATDEDATRGVVWDAVMFATGMTATLTAYRDFAKAREHVERRERASGTLHRDAAVTGSEMLEHAFYHLVNGFQIAYVWVSGTDAFRTARLETRMVICLAATSVWFAREKFPTNSFSKNYKSGTFVDLETVMYRVKKYQYVLYKTVLLHGLNVSLAIAPRVGLADMFQWRMYWLLLNAAYVFEFFLQTLVRRRYIPQWTMLALNQALMVISTVAVIPVVTECVLPSAALVAFVLNFLNRRREVFNVAVALVVSSLVV